MRRTKIVATLGPASESPDTIEKMIDAGVDVFRFNLKHNEPEWHRERIESVLSISKRMNKPVGILVDLQGPEIRIATPNKQPVEVKSGEEAYFSADFTGKEKEFVIPNQQIINELNIGTIILIDDGFIHFEVVRKEGDSVVATALDNYTVGNRKGVNLPTVYVDVPSLTERDVMFLDAFKDLEIAYVALSFIRTGEDINVLKNKLDEYKMPAKIVSKIETSLALHHLGEIITLSDAIMIARGDLGIETPLEEIAYWQNEIINTCRIVGKPVITATQMLQSMITERMPTRAEVTDVANAVFDGTDAIMLSGESAQGKYPVEAVRTMAKIAEFNETKAHMYVPDLSMEKALDQTDILTYAVNKIVSTRKNFDIDAIIVFSETGRTAYSLSRFRLDIPIFAITVDETIRGQLQLSYGIEPVNLPFPEETDVSLEEAVDALKAQGIAHPGNRLLIVHGRRWRVPGSTNTITIQEVL
ncbi:pyruvate kinase [candidate division WWE3 bacterium]|nr:pyruvate kinase [candidate division WWE3 bacterium]